MLASIKSLVLFAVMTYSVSATIVDAPRCVARHKVKGWDCANALSKYKADKHGFVDQDRSDNRKSCNGCQIHVYTNDGSHLRFTMKGAQEALESVLRSCRNGYGSVSIAEELMPGMRVSPTVLSVEKGSGKYCPLLEDSSGTVEDPTRQETDTLEDGTVEDPTRSPTWQETETSHQGTVVDPTRSPTWQETETSLGTPRETPAKNTV